MKRPAKGHLLPEWLRQALSVIGGAVGGVLLIGSLIFFYCFGDEALCDLEQATGAHPQVACQYLEDHQP